MEDAHQLRSLLQLQLASDPSAVLHLPYVLETITPEHFLPSPHTQKWTTRVNSLLHSKDAGARWSGLCLALRTSMYSKSLMMECAQGWVGVALPLLSKDEPVPILKAAIRLLRHIFSSALDVAEFQRLLCTPNVPKASAALISIAEKHREQELKTLAFATLTHLVSLYPTLHRSLQTSLTSLSLKYLNGSSPRPMPIPLANSASRLYSVLHVTGGKVGAGNLWRKSLDETLAFAWGAFWHLTRTHPSPDRKAPVQQPAGSTDDPLVSIPLSLDRLRAAINIICDHLCALTSRPVQVPVGPLVQLCLAMLRCIPDEKIEGHIDSTMRAMEMSVIPEIWSLGCTLLQNLSKSVRLHITPHVPQLASHVAYHLEQQRAPLQRLPFLRAIASLLQYCPYLHDMTLSSRLARAVLPSLTVLLTTQSQTQMDADPASAKGKNKRSRKRARGYEGDEVFKNNAEIMCPTVETGEVLLAALDALKSLLRNAQLTPAIHSIAARVLLSIHLSLPLIQPGVVSPDASLHGRLSTRVRDVCAEIATGTSSTMSKSLPLIIGTMGPSNLDASSTDVARGVDLLLHPRVPPLVRPLPHVETLALFREEEGDEEAMTRGSMGVRTLYDSLPAPEALDPANAGSAALTSTPVDRSHPAEFTSANVSAPAVSSFPMSSTQHPGYGAEANPISSAPADSVPAVAQASETTVSGHRVEKLPVSSLLQANVPPPMPVSVSGTSQHPTPTSRSVVSAPSAPTSSSAPARPSIRPTPLDQDDEDEPMPTIDMDSDSDG